MPTSDLPALRKIAHHAAAKQLSRSGGVEVEDVIQTALADYVAYAANNEVANPGGLIHDMAKFHAIKYRKKWDRKHDDRVIDHAGKNNEGRGPGIEVAGDVPDPLAAVVTAREADFVRYSVGTLDDEDREIAHLTYLHDPPQSAPEVAATLGLAAGTVRNRLVRIRRKLAELLDDDAY